MNIGNRLADRAEDSFRHLQRTAIKQVLIGCPLIGVAIGTIANGIAQLVCIPPTPYEYLVAAFLVAILLQIFDFLSKISEEPTGDLLSRVFTRIFGTRWVPFQDRPRMNLNIEPWRTSCILSIMLLTVANSSSTVSDLPILTSGNWVMGIVLGATIATLRYLMSKSTWQMLLKRGAIQT